MKVELDTNLNIGVAVSGGADSMALLSLAVETGAKITAINVDHAIRGEESVRDSAFVVDYCKAHGIRCIAIKVDALARAARDNVSVELAARLERYEAFDKLLRTAVVDVIALAHHLDDQVETMLMRFMRGTGIRGLRGIVDRDGYIHPLLCYTKDEILDYVKARGIPFVTDSTNEDTNYRRNFFRQEVIPLLKTRYPQLSSVMYKAGKIFEETEDYLSTQLVPFSVCGDKVRFPIAIFDKHKVIIKKSVVEGIRALGVERDVEYSHLEGICALKNAENNARLGLPFGLEVIKEYEYLTIRRLQSEKEFCEAFDEDREYTFAGKKYRFASGDAVERGVTLDADKLPEACLIRTRMTGDTFVRYGGRRKSLSDYLTDKKVPLSERERLLVLAKGSEVYAILGLEVSDKVKIDNNTRKIIKITTEATTNA